MSKFKITSLIIIAFISGGILAPAAVDAAQKVFDETMDITANNSRWHPVYRYDDPDFQVKCWIMNGDREAGITCLPWSEIKER